MDNLTWERLADAEPELGRLLTLAQEVKDPGGASFCANRVWYDQFKPNLLPLVGWDRPGDPVLGTAEAYDLAYRTIYNALPDCRDCLCL